MTPLRQFASAIAMLATVALALGACTKNQNAKPPERVVTVTVASVIQKDLPITESAVGAETALGIALDYDPTRVRGGTFYVRLPFPEQVALRLKPGQTVMLSSFAQPEQKVGGKIQEIRPALSATTLSRDVIVTVSNAGWRPVGSIRGEVTLGVRRAALVVPEHAVVLRPAGSVVYAVTGEVAREQPVRTGVARDGMIEILEGIKAGETVAVDGAALLSNNVKIKVREQPS
jgi:multidrug efflux pump subunit AcrA (membrane-fusion protein)